MDSWGIRHKESEAAVFVMDGEDVGFMEGVEEFEALLDVSLHVGIGGWDTIADIYEEL